MQQMGIEAIVPKPNLSQRNQEHKVYPYLLRGMSIDHPNAVWGTDITYIRLAQGWMYRESGRFGEISWRSWSGSRATSWPGNFPTTWSCLSYFLAPTQLF